MDTTPPLPGPDFGTAGIALTDLAEGALIRGHAHGEPVLLVRRGDELLAVGALCTHFGAPLETGLLVGDTVRCPWHHACFSLRTGEALRAPALDPLACWPDPHTGEHIRVEHWVVAQRQGQTAARNLLGQRQRFDAVPFFWSKHYDLSIRYTGHAEQWEALVVDGPLAQRAGSEAFVRQGQTLAVASVQRDLDNLRAEVALEAHDEAAIGQLLHPTPAPPAGR